MNPKRAEVFQRGFQAFSTGQVTPQLVEEMFREDAVWHFGGSSPGAGHHEGRDAIYRWMTTLIEQTGGTARVEPVDLLDGDRFTMSFTRFTAERDGKEVDVLFADAFRWDEDDLVAEYWSLASDQAAYDSLWS